jgi:hypothetical protein
MGAVGQGHRHRGLIFACGIVSEETSK